MRLFISFFLFEILLLVLTLWFLERKGFDNLEFGRKVIKVLLIIVLAMNQIRILSNNISFSGTH